MTPTPPPSFSSFPLGWYDSKMVGFYANHTAEKFKNNIISLKVVIKQNVAMFLFYSALLYTVKENSFIKYRNISQYFWV